MTDAHRPAPSPLPEEALDQIFRTARSYNGYLNQPVSEADMRAIWDLMKMGPTSANSLPARLVWCVSDDAKARLAECAIETNRAKILTAPVTVIIGMALDFHKHLPEFFPHTDARSWFEGNEALIEATAFRNSSLQGAYLMIAARALGLDAGPMSGFDPERVNQEFFPDEPVRVNFIATLGIGDPASVFARSPRPAFERFNRMA